MKYAVQTPRQVPCIINGVATFVPGSTGEGAPVEMTEKQIDDAKKAGKIVVPFDDTIQPETVTVLKTDLAAAMKTVIVDADKKTGEELKKAVEAVAKAEPVEVKP